MKRKGTLIVLEGVDGCGKSTQCKRLAAALRERFPYKTIFETREPTSGPVGRLIREYLSGEQKSPEEIINLLYVADRYEHIFGEGGILEHLDQGDIVICDRFYYSSFVYSTYKDILDSDIPDSGWKKSFLDSISKNEKFLDTLVPDLLIYLDIPTIIAIERVCNDDRNGREIYETVDKLDLINQTYGYVMEQFNSSVNNDFRSTARELGIKPEWMTELVCISGSEDADSVAATILQAVLPILIDYPPIHYKMVLNPNPMVVKKVYHAIWENDGYCPSKVERIPENRCPCANFYRGNCNCNLFHRAKE